MLVRCSRFRQALSIVLATLLSGVPAVVAAQTPPVVQRSATPIADAAARAALQATATKTEMSPALKWTGFGLIAGGGSLIALAALIDEDHCFVDDPDFDDDGLIDDCETAKKATYLTGGIMAGVGVGLLIMANASRRPVSPTITMRHGRFMIQQQVRF